MSSTLIAIIESHLQQQGLQPTDVTVTVQGVAGMGKSSLLNAISSVAARSPCRALDSGKAQAAIANACDPFALGADSILPQWKIDERDIRVSGANLGLGGYSRVRSGIWITRGLDVALKEVDVHTPIDRFVAEVAHVVRLNHKNVVTTYGVISPLEKRVIVMELAEGTLADRICSLTPKQLLKSMLEIASAVEYLHERRASLSGRDAHLVHLDLKPANVLCFSSQVDDSFNVKICDFGSAQIMSQSLPLSRGRAMTAAYGAPERFGDDPIGRPSDMYSIGVMIWEGLERKTPWENLSLLQISRKHADKQLLSWSDVGAATDPLELALRDVATRLMSSDARVRPTAHELVDRLRGMTDNLLQTCGAPADVAHAWSRLNFTANPGFLDLPPGNLVRQWIEGQFATSGPGDVSVSGVTAVQNSQAKDDMLLAFNRLPRSTRSGEEVSRDNAAWISGLRDFNRRCLRRSQDASIVLAWHGSSDAGARAICAEGNRALRTTDAGYFGAESYVALEAWYAFKYSQKNNMGVFPVVLFAVAVCRPYIVTLERDYPHPEHPGFSQFFSVNPNRAVSLPPGYDAMYVPVRYYGAVDPLTNQPLPISVDYQACANERAEAHELCVSWRQASPIAIVWVTALPNGPNADTASELEAPPSGITIRVPR